MPRTRNSRTHRTESHVTGKLNLRLTYFCMRQNPTRTLIVSVTFSVNDLHALPRPSITYQASNPRRARHSSLQN